VESGPDERDGGDAYSLILEPQKEQSLRKPEEGEGR
jgi:hypothetical protein